MSAPADWQLPPGVSRGVWDYLHDSTLARRYDESLAGAALLDVDRRFVDRHCPPASRVIDLGCGTGRFAVPLAESGQRVTAVDLSPEMLRVTGEKAAAAGVDVDRMLANIVELDAIRDESFDVALCLFATLGMVSGGDARRRVVANACRLLRPAGLFVLHVHARWHHLRTSTGRRWLASDLVRSMLRRPDAGDWSMPHAAGHGGWVMHLFGRREVLSLVKSAGFRIVEVLPVGTGGPLSSPWFLPGLRAYGFLLAAQKGNQ
jgi:SAM-dependent methyltransferase